MAKRKKQAATTTVSTAALVVDPLDSYKTTPRHKSGKLSAIRIAFGKKVESQECRVLFTPPSSLTSSATLTLSFEQSSNSRSSIQNRRKSNSTFAGDVATLCIDLSTIYECQYFLYTSECVVDVDIITNFLAFCVPKSNANGLTRFPNAYYPEKNLDFEKKYIVIEFRCDEQFKNLLASMQAMDAEAVSPLDESSKFSFCLALEKDSQSKRRATRNTGKNRSRRDDFLRGDHDTSLLVYPFVADAKLFDQAAAGLTELATCVATSSANDDTTVVAEPVADHTTTPSVADNNGNRDDDDESNRLVAAYDSGRIGGPVLKINVRDFERLDAPE